MANERVLDQLTRDPDFLSLSEQDQDQMYEELAGKQRVASSPFQDLPSVLGTVGREAAQFFPASALSPIGMMPSLFKQLPVGVQEPFQQPPRSTVGKAVAAGAKAGSFLLGLGAGTPRAAGAVGEAAGPVGRGFERILSNEAGAAMASKTQQALLRAKKVSNAGYGAQMKLFEAAHPERLDVSGPVNELSSAALENPRTFSLLESASRFSGSPLPTQLPTRLTFEEAAELKEALNSIPGFMQKIRNPALAQWDVTELPLVRFVAQLNKTVESAMPEKAGLDVLHAARKAQERLVSFLGNPKSYTRGGAPRLSPGIFRSTSPQVAQAYEAIIPAGIRRELSGVHTAKNIAAASVLGAGRKVLPPFLNRLLFYRTEQ